MPTDLSTKCPHLNRRARAGGLCASCYTVAQRKGFSEPTRSHYVHELIEELDFLDMTWEEAEKMSGRSRVLISQALKRQGRQDLIRIVQLHTYGVVGRDSINSVLKKGG